MQSCAVKGTCMFFTPWAKFNSQHCGMAQKYYSLIFTAKHMQSIVTFDNHVLYLVLQLALFSGLPQLQFYS